MPKTYIFIHKYRKLEAKMHTKTKKEDKKINRLFFLMADASGFCKGRKNSKGKYFIPSYFLFDSGSPCKMFHQPEQHLADLNSYWQLGKRKQKL